VDFHAGGEGIPMMFQRNTVAFETRG
jgi:hypothetical protein